MASANGVPEAKKIKLNENSEDIINNLIKQLKDSAKNLTPIINNDIFESIPNVKVIVGTIKNPKDISKTILTLNNKVPLLELQHLKRVTKRDIIICLVDDLNGENVTDYLNNNVKEIIEVFDGFNELEVPSKPPKIRKQFDESNKIWPCNFHPNKYHENLVSGNFFTNNDLTKHKLYMEIVLEAIKYNIKGKTDVDFDVTNACVVVDPDIQSVVALAFDERAKHPLQHSAMLAIDNVAKTQNGGAWNCTNLATNVQNRGIEDNLKIYLNKIFPSVKFGSKPFKSKRDNSAEEGKDEGCSTGPYLCTGYDVYLMREPCLMCSMGLVHARAKRVFFCKENGNLGGLMSKTKLQTVTSLNHHFEVFTGFL